MSFSKDTITTLKRRDNMIVKTEQQHTTQIYSHTHSIYIIYIQKVQASIHNRYTFASFKIEKH